MTFLLPSSFIIITARESRSEWYSTVDLAAFFPEWGREERQ